MTFKYEVGDMVVVEDGSRIQDYTCGWIPSMNYSVGRKCIIRDKHIRYGRPCYYLRDAVNMRDMPCVWDERGLTPLGEAIPQYDDDNFVYTMKAKQKKVIVYENPL